MANPNVTTHSTLNLIGSAGAVTAADVAIVNNAASSGKAIEIVSLIVNNIDGTNSATLYVSEYSEDDLGGSATVFIQMSVSPGSPAVVIDFPVYVNEDKSIAIKASAAGDLTYKVSYQEIS